MRRNHESIQIVVYPLCQNNNNNNNNNENKREKSIQTNKINGKRLKKSPKFTMNTWLRRLCLVRSLHELRGTASEAKGATVRAVK